MSENIEIEITGREAKLILKYGYPFPDQAEIFHPISGKSGFHVVNVDRYWLEMIVVDLCRSIREVKSESLQEELNSLCNNLEVSIKHPHVRVVN
ncbi:hypothetical protein [Marinibactrum halimedae]|uniref:Uncharacterized protein n=1 Tax=Marinibactrum halimedae TaxID=1444977 RepID=A0AA37T7D4_9GAMM|nr:hypothetical protein [Marinibactrum halimedae]MCD9461371.1 hypothetical protein [Marinibactrum halimedae]GLS26413.1 hypothetical protein GCM10007877_21280 [Marinibactrum halimedae]